MQNALHHNILIAKTLYHTRYIIARLYALNIRQLVTSGEPPLPDYAVKERVALHPRLRHEVTFPKVAACRLRNASILLWQYKRGANRAPVKCRG